MSPDEVVLVTGGTGAIGIPLVESLALDGAEVVVLARGVSPAAPPGVRVVRGDILGGDTLGMESGVLAAVQARVTTIIHAAALTRFDAPLEAVRAVNVEGTRNLLSLAGGCGRLRRVCALSTVYVAGKRTGPIFESELDHDCGFVNAYERSKYEAEQVVREAMGRLPIAVFRLSTVIGDSKSGAVGRLAAIHHAIRFLYQSLLPMMPGAPDTPVDLIATDYAIAAVRHLSGSGFVPGRTFHICAGADAVPQGELIDLAIDAFVRYRPAWRRRAIEKPALVELDTFELFRQSVEAVADSALRASVAVLAPFAPQLGYPKVFDDGACAAMLDPAGIARPPIRDTIMNAVQYLVESNWGSRAGADRGSA